MGKELAWNFRGMGLALLSIILLVSSLLFPPTRHLWDLVDQKLFLFLNSWIATNKFSQNFWAIINYKRFDWVHDIIFLTFFAIFIKQAPKGERLNRILQLLFAVAFIALIILVSKHLFSTIFHIPRDSPSLYFPDCTRLSEEVTWLRVKDYSRSSFPSGHGITACFFVGIVHILMSARMGLFAIFYAIFFILPRLIVGSHWLSDTLVGSASIAILSLAVGYCTPLAQLFTIRRKHVSVQT